MPLLCMTMSVLMEPSELEISPAEILSPLPRPANRVNETVGSNGLPSIVTPGTVCWMICQIVRAYLYWDGSIDLPIRKGPPAYSLLSESSFEIRLADTVTPCSIRALLNG